MTLIVNHIFDNSSEVDDLEPLYPTADRWKHRKLRNYLACIFVTSVVLAAVVALIIASQYVINMDTDKLSFYKQPRPMVNSTCGLIEGSSENDVFIFKGIPYAAPPVGSLRWKYPVSLESKHKCWFGVKSALTFGSKCAQYNPIFKRYEGSEDCLYVNVWTPSLDSGANISVMVYIHGGSLVYKSGHEPGEMPTAEIAKSLGMVLVSFNYRLNVFGFMALEVLSHQSSSQVSGNYGFYDQRMALQWVKNNIRYFGGNPNMITIFGHGGGSESILALMTSSLTKNLFHKAWAMSGFPVLNISLKQAEHENVIFLNKTNCNYSSSQKSLDCIYNLSPKKVLEAIPSFSHLFWYGDANVDFTSDKFQWESTIAIVDGDFLKKTPMESAKAGEIMDIPLLIGNTAQELETSPFTKFLQTWTWKDYDLYLLSKSHAHIFNNSQKILNLYPHQVSPKYEITSLMTDLFITCPTNIQAQYIASQLTSPVYRYIVTSCPSKPVKSNKNVKLYAFHGWDIVSFFGSISQFVDNPSKLDRQFMLNLRKIAQEFVLYGIVSDWSPYPMATGIVSHTVDGSITPYKKQCNLWKDQFSNLI